MRKGIKRAALIALSLVMMLGTFTGCSSKPTAEDAQAYVKATLDLIATGDYDHSVELVDIEEGSEGELRDIAIDAAVDAVAASADLSDEALADFRDVMDQAFSMTKYTVGDAVETGDGEYDVAVSIEPLRIYAGFENFESIIQERAMAEADKIISMSTQEQNDWIMGVIIEMMRANLADPQYDPAEEVTVHYGLLDEENKIYGCSEADGEKLGLLLFSQDGI